jgi:capsular polysaccharide export protein
VTQSAVRPQIEGPLFAHGFSLRKRAYVRGFTGRPDVGFVHRGGAVRPGSKLLLWGNAPVPAGLPEDVGSART